MQDTISRHFSNMIPKGIHFSFDRLIAFLYAITPFTRLYRIPGLGINMAYLPLFGISVLYLCHLLTAERTVVFRISTLSLAVPLCLAMMFYCLLHLLLFPSKTVYNSSADSVGAILSNFLLLLLCVVVFQNQNARGYYIKYVEAIAVFMSFIVIAQTILYYGTGITASSRLAFLPFKPWLEESVKTNMTGIGMVVSGFFRPSAMFLEPAHFSHFCLIGLASSLARNERIVCRKAIIITLGTLLTTSGLGIVSVIMLWGIKLVFNRGSLNETIRRVLVGGILIAFLILGLMVVSDTFRMAVTRIWTPYDGHQSAVGGRLLNATLIKQLSFKELLVGCGYKNIPTYGVNNLQYYMTGAVELLYCQGIIGFSLFMILYLRIIWIAFKKMEFIPLYVGLLSIPFFIGTSNLDALSLALYLPYFYLFYESHRQAQYIKQSRGVI